MELKLLQDFICLAKNANFSRAAAERNVTQAAFSRRIRNLEQWVGAELVDRTTYPVKLTQAGQLFLASASEIAERFAAAQLEASQTAQSSSAKMTTFTAQHSLAAGFYLKWLAQAEAEVGPFFSRTIADNLPNCITAFLNGEADFLFCFRHAGVSIPVDLKRYDAVVIAHDSYVPVSAAGDMGNPKYVLPGTTDAPVKHVDYGRNAPPGWNALDIQRAIGQRCYLETLYENSMGETLRNLARDGVGMTWLPQSLVQDDLDTGALLPAGGPEWSLQMDILLFRDKENSDQTVDRIWQYALAHTKTDLE